MSPKLGLEQKLQQLFFEPEFNPLHVAHGKSILHMTYLRSVYKWERKWVNGGRKSSSVMPGSHIHTIVNL